MTCTAACWTTPWTVRSVPRDTLSQCPVPSDTRVPWCDCPAAGAPPRDVYITAQLCSDGTPLPGGASADSPDTCLVACSHNSNLYSTAAPLVSSCSRPVDVQACHASWHGERSSPLPLCVRVCDLPDGAALQLCGYVTCRDPGGQDTELGCATFPLFSRNGRRLKAGQYTVVLQPGNGARPPPPPHGAATRAKAVAVVSRAVADLAAAERGARRYHRVDGSAPRLDWLDAAALPRVQDQLARARATCVDAGLVLLTFTLPRHGGGAVLFREGPAMGQTPPASSWSNGPLATPAGVGAYATQLAWFDDTALAGREDPCGRRIARLARRLPPLASLALGGAQHPAQPLVPDGQQRRALAACLRAPPSRVPDGQLRELLWTFRWSLRSDPLALPRFLAAVDWTDAAECGAAVAMLDSWALPASSAECAALALWLLSPSFEHSAVRAHAATVVLPRASDDDVSDVLLQLVQALRWESLDKSPLATVLVSRAAQCVTLATWLHWYLTVELGDARFAGRAQSTHDALLAACSPHGRASLEAQTRLVAQLEALNSQLVTVRGHARKRECLRQLLTQEPGCSLARLHPPVTWPLDPVLCVDGVVVPTATVFKSALAPLRLTFRVAPAAAAAAQPTVSPQPPMSPLPPEGPEHSRGGGSEGGTPRLDTVRSEEELLVLASSDDDDNGGSRSHTPSPPPPALTVTSPGGTPLDGATGAAAAAAAAAAQSLAGAMHSLSDLGLAAASAAADGLASLLPSSAADAEAGTPTASDSGGAGHLTFGGQLLAAAHAVVSSVSPAGGHGGSSQPHSVTLIYKQGDDLRQDQLCLQFVRCVDRLLKRDGLDLRLTPYRVLATSTTSGLVQFVPGAVTCSGVLAEHRTLLRFFSSVAPDTTGTSPLGCSPAVYETFLRSCAGYCVITYLLGVGDRHLDNLMLCPDGRLFHIDFGYLFGRDPKQWLGAPPPAMKLSKELTDAMGGTGMDSPGWGRFRTLACEAFSICRKHAPQLAALLRPMGQAAMRDVTPEAALRVEAKLELELSAEEATARFAQLLTDSASAALEGLKENVHRVAQYLR